MAERRTDIAPRPRIGPRETVYENPYQTVYRVRVDFADFGKDIFVTDYGERVGVVVEGPEGILVTRQYRYLLDRVSWEIPGGKLHPGEELTAGARRECREEAGVACGALAALLTFHPGLDVLHNPSHIFCTREFEELPQDSLDAREVCGREWISLPRCIDMIYTGTIVDSLSVISLLSYHVHKTREQAHA